MHKTLKIYPPRGGFFYGKEVIDMCEKRKGSQKRIGQVWRSKINFGEIPGSIVKNNFYPKRIADKKHPLNNPKREISAERMSI